MEIPRSHLVLVSLLALVAFSCVDDREIKSETSHNVIQIGSPRAPCPAGSTSSCNDMYVVAHQDDDLLFINPDIKTSISRGNNVMIVYLTAGNIDALCGEWSATTAETYWTNREKGILSSYKYMMNSTGAWEGSTQQLAGKTFAKNTLAIPGHSGKTVSIVFFRLPDGSLEGLWNGDGPVARLL